MLSYAKLLWLEHIKLFFEFLGIPKSIFVQSFGQLLVCYEIRKQGI